MRCVSLLLGMPRPLHLDEGIFPHSAIEACDVLEGKALKVGLGILSSQKEEN